MAGAEEPQKPQKEKRKLVAFLSQHPAIVVIGFIGVLASIVSVPLGIYLFIASKQYPQLIFYVHPVKATIVRAGEASKLSTSFDNKPIQTDVTAAQVAIWNQGPQPIRKEHILKPIVIYTEKNTPIVEATIRKSSRDVTQLALNTSELQEGRLTVQWQILEQNDGCVIQLIYAGNNVLNIQADGVIEGQPKIEKLEFPGKILSPYEQYESERVSYKSIGYLFVFAGIFFLLFTWFMGKSMQSSRVAYQTLLKSFQSEVDFFDRSISFENQLIETNNKYIADFEERVEEIDEYASELSSDSYKDVRKLPLDSIAIYKQEQENSKKSIEKYEVRKEKALAEKTSFEQNIKKREKRLIIFLVCLILIALLTFLPATYFLFIKQPIGPPFGF